MTRVRTGWTRWFVLCLGVAVGRSEAQVVSLSVPSGDMWSHSTLVGDVSFQLAEVPTAETRQGYCDYRARVSNMGGSKRTVVLTLSNGGSGGGISRMERRVELAPRSQAEVSLMQPALSFRNPRWRVRILETGKEKKIYGGGGNHGRGRWHHSGNGPPVIVLAPLSAEDLSKKLNGLITVSRRGSSGADCTLW